MVPGTPLGAEVAEWFIRSQWLAEVSAEDVAECCRAPRVATEFVRQADAEAGQGFRELCLRLARTDGPAWTHEIDAAVESILAGLNPEGLALEDVLGLYATVTGPSEDKSHEDYEEVLIERMLGIIVDLVRHGIVLPSSLVDWAER